MADQKKLLLTLFGVVLILGGLILGSYGIERYYAAEHDFEISLSRVGDSISAAEAGDTETSSIQLEFSNDIYSGAEGKQKTAYIAGALAIFAIILGAILLKIRKKHFVVPSS